jgi:hypothetical protein
MCAARWLTISDIVAIASTVGRHPQMPPVIIHCSFAMQLVRYWLSTPGLLTCDM